MSEMAGDSAPGRNPGLTLAEQMIEAHGGAALWNRLDSLRAEIALAGFGFRVKFLRHLPFRGTMVVERGGQRVTFEPYLVPGQRGVFEGSEVRIEAIDGRVLSRRSKPRLAFRDFRHLLWWDALDMLHFAGYAGWTYFCVPFVLIDPAYELEDAGTWQEGGETWRKLKVTFPSHIDTHCRQQVFYADNRGGSAATTTPPSRSAPGPRRPTTAPAIRTSAASCWAPAGASTCEGLKAGPGGTLSLSGSMWRMS